MLHCGLIVDETHKPDKDRISCCPLAAVNNSYLKTDRNLQCKPAIGIKRFTVHKSHSNVFHHLLRGYLGICHPDHYAPGITHPSIVAVADSNAVVASIKYQQKHCIEKYAFGWSMKRENISWSNTCGTDAFIVAMTALVVQGRITIEVLEKIPELMQCVHLVASLV
eukprot:scaffold14066_cov40-Cyclotella_meneghiniana.AAC.7